MMDKEIERQFLATGELFKMTEYNLKELQHFRDNITVCAASNQNYEEFSVCVQKAGGLIKW